MSDKKRFNLLNKFVKQNGIVLWGSTSLDEPSVHELIQGSSVSQNVYNRSVSGLKVSDAQQYLEQCVYGLSPAKVIINLGEEDVKCSTDVTQLMEQYRWLLYNMHVALPACRLVVTTVPGKGEACESFNEELKKLAQEVGCSFYRIPEISEEGEYVPVFLSAVKLSLYDSGLGYTSIATKAVFDLMTQ